MGGAALFFSQPRTRRAILSDANARLVRTYLAVRDDVEGVIDRLGQYRYDKEQYLATRALPVDSWHDDRDVAAWFIYLNKTGFNGLYRVNKSGQFNVPFGRYTNPVICDADRLRSCSSWLHGASILCRDFAEARVDMTQGDLAYFDPPYVPLNATSTFTSYTRNGFDMADQVRLRDVAARLVDRGVHVVLSNSSAPAVWKLYDSDRFRIVEIQAPRSINSKADRRGAVKELLIMGLP